MIDDQAEDHAWNDAHPNNIAGLHGRPPIVVSHLERDVLALQFHDTDYEVRIFSEGFHYDHGDEPAIEIRHKGEVIYHTWGIYLPRMICEAADWLQRRKAER